MPDNASLSIFPIIHDAVEGRPGQLAAWLRSDRPLTANDREFLALYVEGYFARGKGRGRPTLPLDVDMFLAIKMVARCKAEKRAQGQSYRYHDAAVEEALDRMRSKGWPTPDRDQLDTELRRSARSSRFKTVSK